MVRIVDDYENKEREREIADKLYSLAEELFGRERCSRGFAGNMNIFSQKEQDRFSVSISPVWGIVRVREHSDYESALEFANHAEQMLGKELTLRTEYQRS